MKHLFENKSICIKGHAMTASNLYVSKDGKQRRCKACKKDWERAKYRARKSGKNKKSG